MSTEPSLSPSATLSAVTRGSDAAHDESSRNADGMGSNETTLAAGNNRRYVFPNCPCVAPTSRIVRMSSFRSPRSECSGLRVTRRTSQPEAFSALPARRPALRRSKSSSLKARFCSIMSGSDRVVGRPVVAGLPQRAPVERRNERVEDGRESAAVSAWVEVFQTEALGRFVGARAKIFVAPHPDEEVFAVGFAHRLPGMDVAGQ